jgi:phosphoglycolate phosphatase
MTIIDVAGAPFDAALIALDKDGTLLDLHAQWTPWMEYVLEQVGQRAGVGEDIIERIARGVGFDQTARHIEPDSPLATASRAEIFTIVAGILFQSGVPWIDAVDISRRLDEGFDDQRMLQPRTDLRAWLAQFRRAGIRVAVVTTDDRAPTQATLDALGLAGLVDAIVCADDGVPLKPAPDMLLRASAEVGVDPAQCVMVGDTVYDMRMGQRAGVGLRVGITGGGGSPTTLQRYANIVISSLQEIVVG